LQYNNVFLIRWVTAKSKITDEREVKVFSQNDWLNARISEVSIEVINSLDPTTDVFIRALLKFPNIGVKRVIKIITELKINKIELGLIRPTGSSELLFDKETLCKLYEFYKGCQRKGQKVINFNEFCKELNKQLYLNSMLEIEVLFVVLSESECLLTVDGEEYILQVISFSSR
jgi:hypothetical protein